MSEAEEEIVLSADPIGMNFEEELLAAQVYRAIQESTNNSERSMQAKEFQIGVSDLGTCSERTRRLLANIPEPEGDKLEAFIGTWVGTGVEEAIKKAYPEVLTQQTVRVTLKGDGGEYEIEGHTDAIFPWGVADGKSADGLEVVKRTGPSQQQLFQRHLYTLGAHNAGLLAVPLEEARTANIWIDRSGRTKELHVHMDTFSWEIVHQATMWLDEVVYAWRNEQVAQKEPPREWCAKACGHYAGCRLYDTDVTGLLRDPEIVAAVALYEDGKKMAKLGKQMKDEANAALRGVTGYVPGFQIRWTTVNASEVSYTRKPYDKLSIVKMK